MATPALAAQDTQLWTTGSVTTKLPGNWRLSEELTGRFSDHRNGLYEIESNTLLGYSVAKGVTFWAGYTHNPIYANGHLMVMERRAREQVTVDNFMQLGAGRVSGRMRLEQRWRSGLNGTGWRIRPFVKYTLPIHTGRKTALIASIEPFFDLNTAVFQRTRGLDRIRSFIGISTPLARNVTAEAGYLNQHIFVHKGSDNNDHVASISLAMTL